MPISKKEFREACKPRPTFKEGLERVEKELEGRMIPKEGVTYEYYPNELQIIINCKDMKDLTFKQRAMPALERNFWRKVDLEWFRKKVLRRVKCQRKRK